MSSLCSPCPTNRYCAGSSSHPKFATFYWSNSDVVYYPSVTNTNRPSVLSDPPSLYFTPGKYLNLGIASLQPGLAGLSATIAAKFTGSPRSWQRLFEFGRGSWSLNIILARVWGTSTIRLDSYQIDQSSYDYTAWSEASITPCPVVAQSVIYNMSRP